MIEKSQKCKQALAFAAQKHEGQRRKLGEPYITHPIAVAEMMVEKGLSEDYIIAALFHDLLEDTDATEKEISDIGGEAVLASVKLLTKEQNYQMDSYIAKIKENPIARAVKAADRIHNLSCAHVCSEGFKLRYIKESIDYYLDFDPQVAVLVHRLIGTLENPENVPREHLERLNAFLDK
jgi:(p)ppGpp synthase/HD superfamily hydrolase